MAVHEIRAGRLNVLSKPVGEWKIQVARTKQISNLDARATCRRIDPRLRRANQRTVMTPLEQRRNQVNHLLRATVKMAPGFDMQYFHGSMIL